MSECCPVCYEELADTPPFPCTHVVHDQCIIKSGKARCPICRQELNQFIGKVQDVQTFEPLEGDLYDALISAGFITSEDLEIFDGMDFVDDLQLVKAVLMVFILKQMFLRLMI